MEDERGPISKAVNTQRQKKRREENKKKRVTSDAQRVTLGGNRLEGVVDARISLVYTSAHGQAARLEAVPEGKQVKLEMLVTAEQRPDG